MIPGRARRSVGRFLGVLLIADALSSCVSTQASCDPVGRLAESTESGMLHLSVSNQSFEMDRAVGNDGMAEIEESFEFVDQHWGRG